MHQCTLPRLAHPVRDWRLTLYTCPECGIEWEHVCSIFGPCRWENIVDEAAGWEPFDEWARR